jgi:hypothetical protein
MAEQYRADLCGPVNLSWRAAQLRTQRAVPIHAKPTASSIPKRAEPTWPAAGGRNSATKNAKQKPAVAASMRTAAGRGSKPHHDEHEGAGRQDDVRDEFEHARRVGVGRVHVGERDEQQGGRDQEERGDLG